MKEHVSQSTSQTAELATSLAHQILGHTRQSAIVVALEGDLGAGKTTFTQAFAQALGVSNKVKSPTFNLIKKYSASGRHLYHIDCYRLKNSEDLKKLGIGEVLQDPNNIVLIEWAERVEDILPRNVIRIYFDHLSQNSRKIKIDN